MGFRQSHPCNKSNSKDYPSKNVILKITVLLLLLGSLKIEQGNQKEYSMNLK